jgi:hypothetical protein
MDTLRCFLADNKDGRHLFEGTYIQNSPVWKMANSAPVFKFNFKDLSHNVYKEEIAMQVIRHVYEYIGVENLKGADKLEFEKYLASNGENAGGLLLLTNIVFNTTGKKSYLLIDEYDKLLWDSVDDRIYKEIRTYETILLGKAIKDNPYLEKALLTGVTRISRESLMSGLNNLVTYDFFTDKVYTTDFGLTEEEISALQTIYNFDTNEIRQWYNGIKINKTSIYNIYSVLSYVSNESFGNYWGRSGSMEIIRSLLNIDRQETISRLLNNEAISVHLNQRISLQELTANPDNGVFYSLLVQCGYFSVEDIDVTGLGTIKIPNIEIMNVWKEFILTEFIKKSTTVRTLFDNADNLSLFDEDIMHFLSDRLSFFDIDVSFENKKASEKTYHTFVLGLLSAYENISCKKPQSNKESGDGRYDILFEHSDLNIIFEFKSVKNPSQLKAATEKGLKQIDEMRYYAEVPHDKPLIKTAIAFCGKQCLVKSRLHIR